MIEEKLRKDGEPFAVLLRRFNRKVQEPAFWTRQIFALQQKTVVRFEKERGRNQKS